MSKTYTQDELDAAISALQSKNTALVETVKRRALQDAGLKGADINLALDAVSGETEDEIKASIESLGDSLPVLMRVKKRSRGIDPQPGNPRRWKPEPVDLQQRGYDRVNELFKSGKIGGVSSYIREEKFEPLPEPADLKQLKRFTYRR